ncbi:hypothetical protein P43SY_004841 [Pythium insidiosum]|uniref:PH domain-containing protein n=1 Tax=Pythium insidiosum TaxID=114742 RepID=A0AAD5LMT4_PYTIN|nr:hypothetical protein P43SY_004841 [Pythium insidiosum]
MAESVHAVLKEGFLKKRSRGNVVTAKWQRRYFRLYPGELVYFQTPTDPIARRRVELHLDTAVTKTNDQGYPHCFVIKSSSAMRDLYLQAENDAEKDEWATAVFDAARRTADVAAAPSPALTQETAAPVAPASPSRQPASPPPPSRVLLHMNVVEARQLIAVDINGKSDPYCVVTLIGKDGQSIETEAVRTPYITDSLDPVWNQHFTIGNAVDLRSVEAVHLDLRDHNNFMKNTSLGFVKFYGINGCIHHLNSQIPRAHREKLSSDEVFQARAGLEGQAQLEISVLGAAYWLFERVQMEVDSSRLEFKGTFRCPMMFTRF